MDRTLGVYIHIPFCASKCGYCDFYSLAGCDRLMPRYQQSLVDHIRECLPAMSTYYIDTVYIGGGTPSYYGAKRLCELINEIKKGGRLLKASEITVEVNPDSVDLKELKLLRKEGVNRLSIGVQSSNNDILKLIGRRHNWKQVEMAVRAARSAGFDNLSLDLIYGLPSQTKTDWADTLTKALALHPEHISCYGLTLEERTPMYELKGSPFLPTEDEQADMYMYAVDYLNHYGYSQYEVSNFAIKGYESRHNIKYWKLHDYIGFGASANSCIGGVRYSYKSDVKTYIAGVYGQRDIVDGYERISGMERAAEYIMLGMRTIEGISADDYHNMYPSDFAPIEARLEEYVEKGWAEREGNSWHFTSSGFLLSNILINALLEAQAGNRVNVVSPWLKDAFDSQEKVELPPGDEEVFRAMYGLPPKAAKRTENENGAPSGSSGT